MVVYSYLGSQDGHHYYNLGFGDYDPRSKNINDLAVSNNKDRDKILATVAATALEFTGHISGCRIMIRGSTAGRTMGALFWKESCKFGYGGSSDKEKEGDHGKKACQEKGVQILGLT